MSDIQPVQSEDPMKSMMTMANSLSKSDLLPAHFKGKPANVFLALQFCESVGLDYFTGLQGIYVVHGRTSLYTPLLIGLANQRGPFDGPIRFESSGKGESMAVTAFGMIGQERYEKTVSMAMAKAEGWTKNPKYKTIPDQMLSYRAATFLIRTYCPEVTGSTLTSDEVHDIEAAGPRHAKAEVLPQEGVAAELNAQLAPKPEPESVQEPEIIRAPRPKPKSEENDDDPDLKRWAEGGMFDK